MTPTQVFSKYSESIKDDIAIVKYAKGGLDADVFFEIAELTGISKKALAEDIFDVSIKTMVRYQKERKKLNPKNSELALKLLQVCSKGVELFGEMTAFIIWIKKPSYGLGNRLPIDLMDTITGIDLVEEELLRIEYGALA